MTQHVTIALDEPELDRARALADTLGVSVEEYLQRLVRGILPTAPLLGSKPDINSIIGSDGSMQAPDSTRKLTCTVADIFDLVTDGEPTDIALDKDRLIGEAIIKHHADKSAAT